MVVTALFSKAEQLLLLASLAHRRADEQAALEALVGQMPDWKHIEILAIENAILPMLYRALHSEPCWTRVPVSLQETLVAHARSIAETNRARITAVMPVVRRLAAEAIPVIMLKGIYLAESLYQDASYKRMNDVDFLVTLADARKLYAIYEELGFFCVAPLMGDSAQRQEKYSHHMPPFVSRDLTGVLGTHWGLISPLTPYKIDIGSLWERKVPFDFYGVQLWAMAPEDNLHHLCVHLPYYKTGLRELMDLYNLVREQGDRLDWEAFLARVQSAGTEELVFHALSLCQALVPDDRVRACLRLLESRVGGFYLTDTLRKIAHPARILRSRATQVSKVERAYGEFSLTWDLKEKTRAYLSMWRHATLPPRREVEKMNYLKPGSPLVWLYYPLNPVRIARLLAKDLGWKLFWLVNLKEIIDLVSCAWLTLTRPAYRGQTLAAFAKRFDLTPEQLRQLKGALE